LFLTIIAPRFFQYLSIYFYKNHIVICGLNQVTMNLVEKFGNKKIVVLAEEQNAYSETLKQKGIHFLIGDFSDENILNKLRIDTASQLYAVVNNDKTNVKIALSVYSFLEKKNRHEALKCFMLIKDRHLKTLLEESALFKYKTDTFDGILFNISEIGIKYGISINIDIILPAKMEKSPEILLVSLTEKTEIVLLNLAHCLTMQRAAFRFAIVEENEETIRLFQKKYAYLQQFVEISLINEINPDQPYESIIICIENQTEAIKQAIAIRYLFGKNSPNILVFCDDSGTLNKVFNQEGKINQKGEKEIFPLKDRNIFIISLFDEISNYIFVLDKSLEEKAKITHDFWSQKYGESKEYDKMSGHLRQANRNQVLDNYLRTYLSLGEKFESIQNCLDSFPDDDRETLAMMEHRRWMIEKYENGWVYGARRRPDEFKRHDCLVMWDILPENERKKDFEVIDLMMNLIKNPKT